MINLNFNGWLTLTRPCKSTQIPSKKRKKKGSRILFDTYSRIQKFSPYVSLVKPFNGVKPSALSAVSVEVQAAAAAAGNCGRVQRKPELHLVLVRGDGCCVDSAIPPLTPALCRQLMFICSAHLGLVTKHLAKLPLCMWRFTEWWQGRGTAVHPFQKRSWKPGRTSSQGCQRLILKAWLNYQSIVQHSTLHCNYADCDFISLWS